MLSGWCPCSLPSEFVLLHHHLYLSLFTATRRVSLFSAFRICPNLPSSRFVLDYHRHDLSFRALWRKRLNCQVVKTLGSGLRHAGFDWSSGSCSDEKHALCSPTCKLNVIPLHCLDLYSTHNSVTVLAFEGADFQGVHCNVQMGPGSEHQAYFDWHCASICGGWFSGSLLQHAKMPWIWTPTHLDWHCADVWRGWFSRSLLQCANMPWIWTPSLFWLALCWCLKGLVFQGVCYNMQRCPGSERQAHLDRPERVPRVHEVRFLWDHWTPLCSTRRESKLSFVPVMLLCILILSVSGLLLLSVMVCF